MTSPEWARQLTLQIARRTRDLHDQDLAGKCGLCRERWPCGAARRAAKTIDSLTGEKLPRAVGIAPVHPRWLAGTEDTDGQSQGRSRFSGSS